MTEKEKSDGRPGSDMKTPGLVHLLTFSVLISGAISTAHSHSHEMEISAGRSPPNSGQIHQLDRHINDNKTIHRENVSSRTGFDKMLRWILDNEVEKGESSCDERRRRRERRRGRRRRGERSLRFKFGERFAFRKRLQFALLPIMYKMGVMTTLLTGLTVLVLKGLTIGVILLIFAFGNYFTKLHKQSSQSAQPIHVHVHSQDGHSKVSSFPAAAGPWDRVADEVHPSAYLTDNELESYRRRLIQNSAAMIQFKPLS